jgi:hypothetical protein
MTRRRQQRADLREGAVNIDPHLPDSLDDDGCPDLGIASCLCCPLPVCRYDLPPKIAGVWLRMARVRQMTEAGATITEIKTALGVSRRTVFRLKRYDVTAALPVWER